MMGKRVWLFWLISCYVAAIHAADLFIEAESFKNKGGWVVDQQFMDEMGSPYLLAHGMGNPVNDACTEVTFPETGIYYAYVRTYNWTSPWKEGEGPGKFALYVNNKRVGLPLGTEGKAWMWQPVGKIKVKDRKAVICLRDLTGFDGRCDAVYFIDGEESVPPSEVKELESLQTESFWFSR